MISEITQGNDVLGSFKLIDLVSESNEQLVQCGEMFSVSSVGVQDHSEASGMSEESEKKSAVFTPTKKPLSRVSFSPTHQQSVIKASAAATSISFLNVVHFDTLSDGLTDGIK